MTEANSNTSSLTKQRWQELIVIQSYKTETKTMTEANSNTSSLTKQRQKQWQELIVIHLVLQNRDKNNDRS